jgi:hypothetical protein
MLRMLCYPVLCRVCAASVALWLWLCGYGCECAGYLILDKDDPTKILQRESRMLWPKYNWERANQTDPATDWEYYKNCSEYYVTWRTFRYDHNVLCSCDDQKPAQAPRPNLYQTILLGQHND